jgi:hypothetical protein
MRRSAPQVFGRHPDRRLLRVLSSFAHRIGDSVVRGIDRVDPLIQRVSSGFEVIHGNVAS